MPTHSLNPNNPGDNFFAEMQLETDPLALVVEGVIVDGCAVAIIRQRNHFVILSEPSAVKYAIESLKKLLVKMEEHEAKDH